MTATLRRLRLLVMVASALSSAALAAEATPQIQARLREIDSAAFRGTVDELRIRHQEAAKQRPNDLLARVYVAWCAMPSDGAWNQLKGLTVVNPSYVWARLGMGRIYLDWKLKEQAETEFKTALKADPKFYPALIGLGDVARAAGRYDEAVTRYREALAIADDPEAQGGLGLALLELGKRDEAKLALRQGVDLWPDQPKVLQALSELARQDKDLKAAAKYLALMLDLTPRDKQMRRQLAEYRLQLGDHQGAAEQYERYLRYAEGDGPMFRELAEIHRVLKDPAGEQRALEQLSGAELQSPDGPLRLSKLAEERRDLESAEAQLMEAAARAPQRADIKLELGRLLARRYKLKEAIETYREAAAATEQQTPEIAKERLALEQEVGLFEKAPKGTVEQVNRTVSAILGKFYLKRLEEHPELEGTVKAKVRISAEGKANSVEIVEDTIGDPLISAHVYFALKDADYAKKKRDPLFEFELKPPKGRR